MDKTIPVRDKPVTQDKNSNVYKQETRVRVTEMNRHEESCHPTAQLWCKTFRDKHQSKKICNITWTLVIQTRAKLGILWANCLHHCHPKSALSVLSLSGGQLVLNPILTRGVCLPMCESGLGRLVLWWAPRMRQKLRNKGQADPTWLFRYTGMIL